MMAYRMIMLIAYLWIMIYTVSYAVFEYKEKNRRGALGIAILCAIFTVMAAGAVI